MKKCVKWFLLVGILFCLLGTGIVTAGLMKGGAQNAKQHVRQIEEHLDDFTGNEL